VVAYRRQPASLLLQDVLRSYLRVRLGAERLRELGGVLCDAVARSLLPAAGGEAAWWELPEQATYLWTYLVRQLAEAGRAEDVGALLRDLRWSAAKLARPQLGPVAVEADLTVAEACLPADLALRALRRTLVQTAHLLAPTDPPTALGAVLLSRLDGIPALEAVRAAFAPSVAAPRLLNRWSLPDQPHPALLRVLAGHHRWVNDLAVAPDGSWLLSAGNDGTVRVWDVEAGRSRLVLRGHVGAVQGCTVAPDGSWLASAGSDGTVRIWDAPAADGDGADAGDPAPARLVLTGHAGVAADCAATADGTGLVSVGVDGMLRVWDVVTGAARLAEHVPTGPLCCCAVAPDGTWLATGGEDGSIRIWDPLTGVQRAGLAGHAGSVLGLAPAADGTRLVSAGADGTVRLWAVATGGQPSEAGRNEASRQPSEAGGRIGGASRLRSEASRQLRTLTDGSGPVRDCVVAPDGSWLAAAGWEGIVRIWDAATGRQRAELTGPMGGTAACALSPDGTWLASAGRYGVIRIWDVAAGAERGTAGSRDDAMRGCVVMPDGRAVVSVAEDGTATRWDVTTGEPGAAVVGEGKNVVRGCAAAPDGSWVAVPGRRGAARLWEPDTGAVRAVLTAGCPLRGFDVAPDGSWLAGACDDGSVRIWDTDGGEWLASLRGHAGPVQACAVSPDGSWLASVGDDRTVRLWDMATLQQRRPALTGHTDGVLGVAIGPDAEWVASTGADHTVRVWDPATGRPVAVLRGHTHTVRSAAGSPDGRWLATAGGDGTVRIWDTTGWGCGTLMRFDGAARSCCWAPDSGDLAVAGSAGLYLYTFDPG
jgi:WD40 repeat protein